MAAYDNEGMVFAAGIDSQHVKLYDVRKYEQVCCLAMRLFCLEMFSPSLGSIFRGPSAPSRPWQRTRKTGTGQVSDQKVVCLFWSNANISCVFSFLLNSAEICFSPDGKKIAVTTSRGVVFVLDAYRDQHLCTAGAAEPILGTVGLLSSVVDPGF